MSGRLARFGSFALRGCTLVSKFLLIFILARYLEPGELGLYGLLIAAVGYSLYLLGLDFYTFSTREILRRRRDEWGGLLKSQGALTLTIYVLLSPILLLVFILGYLPWYVAGWFFLLVVLEHFNQESMRLLIAISEPISAGISLFLRSGAWAAAIAALIILFPKARTLDSLLMAWALGGVFAALFSIWRLCRVKIGGWRVRIDWGWIARGVKIALPLLVATLALRGLFTFDRYWLEVLSGIEVVGAYVFYMGIASAMMSFLDAGVFAFIYPGLITSYQRGEAFEYRRGTKKMLVQTTVFTMLFTVVALVAIEPFLAWLDKPLYQEVQGMFPWLLLASILYALGMVPHYALYAQGQDRPLVFSHIASLIVFGLATWLFSFNWPQLAIPFGLTAAFLLILVWKCYAYFRLTPPQYRNPCPESSRL